MRLMKPRRTWKDLGLALHQEVRSAVHSLGFPTATPVQAATVPLLLTNKDVAAEAVTGKTYEAPVCSFISLPAGSGKTLAFLIPVLQLLKQRGAWKKHEIGAVVLSPTRELALQTSEVLRQLLRSVSGLKEVLFVGGNSVEEDVRNFRENGGNVVICTPGRFEDLLTRKKDLNLPATVKSLVIWFFDFLESKTFYFFKNNFRKS